MSATLLKANQEEASFLIEIDGKTFLKALMEEYNKDASAEYKKNIPALLSPEAILGKYPQLDKIASKALEKLMPAYYNSAIKKLSLNPITFPKIMPRPTVPGQPCIIEISVTLEPKIELQKFEGLEVNYTPVLATEEDLAQQMAGLRKQHGAENDDAILLKKMPFDSIETLKENILNSLTEMAKEKTEFYKKDAVIKKLIEANPFTVKEEIIEQQIMLEINQVSKQMGPQFINNYMKSSGRSMADLKKEVRPQAEKTVKQNLLLSAIADTISPEVTEEDIKATISKQQGSFMDFTEDYEARRKRIDETPGTLDQIKHLIRLEKAAEYVMAKATLLENKPANIMDELPEYMK